MKFKSILTILSACILLVGCSNSTTDNPESQNDISSSNTTHNTFKISNDDPNRIDVGIEMDVSEGNRDAFEKFDKETQEMLKQYLSDYINATIQAMDNQNIVSYYKTINIKEFEDNYSDLFNKYVREDVDMGRVLLDFYELPVINATYEAKVLKFTTYITENDVIVSPVIDDTYLQYIGDLTDLMKCLSEEYIS